MAKSVFFKITTALMLNTTFTCQLKSNFDISVSQFDCGSPSSKRDRPTGLQ